MSLSCCEMWLKSNVVHCAHTCRCWTTLWSEQLWQLGLWGLPNSRLNQHWSDLRLCWVRLRTHRGVLQFLCRLFTYCNTLVCFFVPFSYPLHLPFLLHAVLYLNIVLLFIHLCPLHIFPLWLFFMLCFFFSFVLFIYLFILGTQFPWCTSRCPESCSPQQAPMIPTLLSSCLPAAWVLVKWLSIHFAQCPWTTSTATLLSFWRNVSKSFNPKSMLRVILFLQMWIESW